MIILIIKHNVALPQLRTLINRANTEMISATYAYPVRMLPGVHLRISSTHVWNMAAVDEIDTICAWG